MYVIAGATNFLCSGKGKTYGGVEIYFSRSSGESEADLNWVWAFNNDLRCNVDALRRNERDNILVHRRLWFPHENALRMCDEKDPADENIFVRWEYCFLEWGGIALALSIFFLLLIPSFWYVNCFSSTHPVFFDMLTA